MDGARRSGIGGALVQALYAPYAILADAVSFVASTLFMVTMRHRETPPKHDEDTPRPKMWPQVKEGLHWVVGHPWLRAIAACTGSSNFFSSLLFAISILYMLRDLHMPKYQLGLVFGVGSAGSILGALLVSRLNKRIGVGPSIVITAISFSLGGLGYALTNRALALPVLLFAQTLFGFGSVAYNITQVSLRQAITPERLQGRMNAAMRWIVWGTIPLGSLAGGAIASTWTLHTAIWVGAIGGLVPFLPVALTSVRSIREMPEPVQEPTPAQAELAGGLEPSPLALDA